MEFVIDNFPDKKFNISLISNIKNFDYLSVLEKRDDLVILNPDYIVSVYQIMLSINRALFNFYSLKKHKTEKLKKEIIYFSSEKGKIDMCMKTHTIINHAPQCYLIFIDLNKDQIEEIKKSLDGDEILPENYSKFVKFEKVLKEFDIKYEEIDNDSGIMGAVYNRIAIKDLK